MIAGQSPPSSTYNRDGVGLPFFQGKADYGEKYPTVRYWCNEPAKIALPNDILISVRAPVGPVNINNVKSCIGRGLTAIRAKENINQEYIYYFLKTHENKIAKLGVGSTFSAITQQHIKELRISIPENLEDQIRIASLLSRIEELIAKRKESIRLLDEFVKSTFLEMFGDPVRNEKGWEVNNLDDVTISIQVGVVVQPASYYTDNGVIALRSLNIKPGAIDLTNIVHFKKEAHDGILSKSKLKTGDVLVVRTGNPGVACIVPSSLNDINCIDLLIIRPDYNKLISQYIVFILNSTRGRKLSLNGCVGSSQQHLNVGTIKTMRVPVPPLILQNQFANIVGNIETIRIKYQVSLTELEKLYGAVSQRAFRGRSEVDSCIFSCA